MTERSAALHATPADHPDDTVPDCDVLVVGAGPTGLALAATLHAGGSIARLVDQNLDRAHESRALVVQPRTLEVLRGFGLADQLVARGNPAVHLSIHAGTRAVPVRLFDIRLDDTAFPFLLFVSQAETEAVLSEHLAAAGCRWSGGVRLEEFRDHGDQVLATLRNSDGTQQHLRSRYLAGCDGAHSTVREQAGIPFVGGGYQQTFLLADLDVDGLEADTVNAFLVDSGPLLFFPLGRPAPWRVITMRPRTGRPQSSRLPDARVSRSGQPCWLQEALSAPAFYLLLAGPADGWDELTLAAMAERHGTLLAIHRLDRRSGPGVLADPTGPALSRLHVRGRAHFVVRPDGHVGCRGDSQDLAGAQRYLAVGRSRDRFGAGLTGVLPRGTPRVPLPPRPLQHILIRS